MTVNLAQMIDYTNLKPDAVEEDIIKLVAEAIRYNFAAVCVSPIWAKTASELLRTTPEIKVATVVGFPLGTVTPRSKVFEAEEAIANGATELDMVINIGALKDRQDHLVTEDIQGVVWAAREQALVKVIIETGLLTPEEIVRACKLAVDAGADFIKTSTGFARGRANEADVALIRKTVGANVGVKASGGITTRGQALAMLAAGANRIGTSSGVALVKTTL